MYDMKVRYTALRYDGLIRQIVINLRSKKATVYPNWNAAVAAAEDFLQLSRHLDAIRTFWNKQTDDGQAFNTVLRELKINSEELDTARNQLMVVGTCLNNVGTALSQVKNQTSFDAEAYNNLLDQLEWLKSAIDMITLQTDGEL